MPEFQVEQGDAGTRLDLFLAGKLPHLSRSRIQALIKTCDVRLNAASARASATLRRNDVVQVEEPPVASVDTLAEEIPLDVLFEDEDLIVINKPAGLVAHPAPGNPSQTLVNALLYHCRNLSGIGGERRPGIVHRLDKETSGCLVAAKNDFTHLALSQQFAARMVTKIYLALVAGHLKTKTLTVESGIGRHPVHRKKMTVLARGRPARTDFRVLREFEFMSLVECILHTGRTHQIRVHLKHLGHPVLGDRLYAPKLTAGFPRQMLHAWQLGFTHPRNAGQLIFRAPLPADFVKAGVPQLPTDE